MACQRRAVLEARTFAVAFHAGQMQQHREPATSFHKSPDRRAVQAEDQVTLPMPTHGTVGDLSGPLADYELGGDELLASSSGAGPGHAQRPPGAQARRQFTT